MVAVRWSRRRFVVTAGGGLMAGAVLGACGDDDDDTGAGRLFGPGSAEVRDAEARRRLPGARVRDVSLVAGPAEVDLGDRVVPTLAFGPRLAGPEIRVSAGDVLRAEVRNELTRDLSIHWHGIALRNDMDGVPGLTQDPISAGSTFVYEFTVPDPGTYFFHPHVGILLDYGLYAPLIVEDPAEPGAYDAEWVVVLDDWVDGVGSSPDDILADLLANGMPMGGMDGTDMGGSGTSGMDMSGMDHGTAMGSTGMMTDSPLGGDAGDVTYPLHLLNGRVPAAPDELAVRPGGRVRIRLVNAASDTAYRVAMGGHRLTVTHTDGFPVDPVDVDTLVLAMGERYDVTVTVQDGVWPLVAVAEGKDGQALGVIRAGAGDTPPAGVRPGELNGRMLALADLRATEAVSLVGQEPSTSHDLVLGGDMIAYRWTINGATMDTAVPIQLREGERHRLVFDNQSMMFHPMHVHGHTFQIPGGPRKDTVIVRPMERITVDLAADNPGAWALHCHNAYHAEAGMMTVLQYVASR